jgi:hypothetical protein
MPASRQPQQRNAELLLKTTFAPHTNVGIAALERAMRKYIDRNGWTALDTLLAAVRTRYTAIAVAPSVMNGEGARMSHEGRTPVVGEVVRVIDPGQWDGIPVGVLTYAWEAGGTPIGGATSASFTVTSSEIGAVLTCVVTCTNSVDDTSSETPASLAVVAA